eukprot:gene17592-6694_t
MRYLLLCCVLLHSTIARGVYVTTPEEHGAKGDGKTNDWIAILAAVSSCEGYTRCTVSFNKNYLSGPIQVNTSGVTLNITGTLAMLAKANYPLGTPFITTPVSVGTGAREPCRTVETGGVYPATLDLCISNLTITGGGTIKATDAWQWWLGCAEPWGPSCGRPHLVVINAVQNLVLHDIHLLDPPNHHIEVDGCLNVRVDRFTATAPHDSPNSDGINFYGGFDQSLSDSVISN